MEFLKLNKIKALRVSLFIIGTVRWKYPQEAGLASEITAHQLLSRSECHIFKYPQSCRQGQTSRIKLADKRIKSCKTL